MDIWIDIILYTFIIDPDLRDVAFIEAHTDYLPLVRSMISLDSAFLVKQTSKIKIHFGLRLNTHPSSRWLTMGTIPYVLDAQRSG